MKSVLTVVAVLAALVVGAAAVVLGEGDDSPGLQFLGVLMVGGAGAAGVRSVRRRR